MRVTLVALIACVLIAASTSLAASPGEIQKSIDKGKEWLYKQQQNGNWDESQTPLPTKDPHNPNGAQFSGRTALVVLALLSSGESPQDPRLKPAIDFLLKTRTEGVYALGLRCQVWSLIPSTPASREAMQRDSRILLTSMKQVGNAKGMYDYLPTKTKSYSHSRSQYAVLGMWAAAQTGVEVPDSYWRLVEDAWRRNQDPSGGWTYMHPAETKLPVTPGMTTVGVATLFITQEYLRAQDGVLCKGNQTNDAIEKGIKWLGDNMDKFATDKRYERDNPFPTLYAFERVGVASGLRYFGGVDWFEKGSDWIIKKQNADGSWPGTEGQILDKVVMTSFPMLFLAKGRAPIVISKLQYNNGDKPGHWNQRARDAANAARWIGRTIERDLTFQVVDSKASLDDMLESPLMYLAGNETVTWSDADKSKIKAYIEGGGILLANADCGAAAFATSIKNLAKELFPEAEFGELPEDDILYTNYYPRKNWKTKPSVQALTNGARKLMVLVPQADPAKAWQLQDNKAKQEMFELPADLLLYAVDRQNLRYRGERYYVSDDPSITPKTTITIARLKYPGFWDPEPGGWRRLNSLLKRTRSTAIETKPAELGKGQIGDAKIAHLTGTYEYNFTDAQQDEMKKFVEVGGTLVIDAAGGSSKFAVSVENALAKMYPDQKLEMLPPDHALYASAGGKADEITYRNYAIRNGVGRTTAPRLQGITVNGRLGVIYSREDLSVGLVGQAVDGIIGYSPATATHLMTRILDSVSNLPPASPKASDSEKAGSKSAKPKTSKKPKP